MDRALRSELHDAAILTGDRDAELGIARAKRKSTGASAGACLAAAY